MHSFDICGLYMDSYSTLITLSQLDYIYIIITVTPHSVGWLLFVVILLQINSSGTRSRQSSLLNSDSWLELVLLFC